MIGHIQWELIVMVDEMPKNGFKFVDRDKVSEWAARMSSEVYKRHGKDHFENRHIFIMGYNSALNDLLSALDSGVLCFQETE
jgi:hypothetical protein